MKKLILALIVLMAFAKDNKYLNYTKALLHYHIVLKNFNKIKAPFEKKSIKIKAKRNLYLNKRIDIKLISVFNNNAYIVVNKYMGNNLIKSYKKWVKKGDVFEKYYKVKKIALDKIVFEYKNKIIIKTLNRKIPGIKEK